MLFKPFASDGGMVLRICFNYIMVDEVFYQITNDVNKLILLLALDSTKENIKQRRWITYSNFCILYSSQSIEIEDQPTIARILELAFRETSYVLGSAIARARNTVAFVFRRIKKIVKRARYKREDVAGAALVEAASE